MPLQRHLTVKLISKGKPQIDLLPAEREKRQLLKAGLRGAILICEIAARQTVLMLSGRGEYMISSILQKMIAYSEGSLHDIDHFIKVHSYAKLIAETENLDAHTQTVLEIAAIVHDIACPALRAKYGRANGKLQETEGAPMARMFLRDFELSAEQTDRIVFLVAHHHTVENIDGLDYQILLEADYIVNAGESGYSRENIENACETLFKTESGKKILKSIFLR